MHKAIIIIFIVLTNFFASPFARADNYLLNRSYFEDTSNSLSLAQVEHEKFTPFQEALTAGYRSGTYWLRLKIAASTQPLVLKIRPIFTEEIELFDPSDPDRKALVGLKHPWQASKIESVSYNFALVPSSHEREVYLRIKSARSYLVKVEVMDQAQYQNKDRIELLIYTGYATLTFLLALWLLVTWLIHRELVLGLFALQQCIAFFHTLLHGGLAHPFLNKHLDPLFINTLFSTLVVLYPLAGILANKFLLQEYGLKKFYRVGFNFLCLISMALIALHFLTHSSLTFNLNSILVFIAILFFLIAAIFGVDLKEASLQADALSIQTLRIFYTLNVILWMIAILPLQGLLKAGEMTMHSLHIYGMLSGLIFFFLLQHRDRALLKLEASRATALKAEADHERHQRAEQAMLMAMLSHEIKTPLSVLKIIVDEKVNGTDLEGHANRAVSNIDFIVERCLQLGRLDAKALHPIRNNLNFSGFFKNVIAEHKAEERVSLQCPEHLDVHTDPEMLRIVISNLLENALKYSLVNSIIYLEALSSTSNSQAGVQVRMSNDIGPMGEPDPEHIFKKYYRNSSATKISGSGLGLYLVHELVRVLGGSIKYQPNDKRVTFTIWIPT